jgi:hypothetical protein
MRFYTKEECEAWLDGRKRRLPDEEDAPHHLTIWYPPNPADIDFLWIANLISSREPVFLWITEWGIWPSSENWHLYYRLRQSYHDDRLLHEAPGHLFQNYEMADLATFLQVAATNGWGGYILTSLIYVNAFFSHDEYIHFFASNDSITQAIRERFDHLLEPPDSFHSTGPRQRITQQGNELTPAELHPEHKQSDEK